ncbi:MAG: ATP-binding protein [Flavobacteriales bacterium]|nr:ATP-binding protein [Flavobacteriales bacterium]
MKKIVLIGPESTAKSTLAESLSEMFGGALVGEYSRQYAIEHGGGDTLTVNDVMPIVMGQMALEDALTGNIAFLDSNPLGSAVYSQWYYGVVPQELAEVLKCRKYDMYLLCAPDIAWEKDPARCMNSQKDREAVFSLFEKAVKQSGVMYHMIRGTGEKRLQNAVKALEKAGIILKETSI